MIVCSYPQPVRMMRCQNLCSCGQQVSVNGSFGVREPERWSSSEECRNGTRAVFKTESRQQHYASNGLGADEKMKGE